MYATEELMRDLPLTTSCGSRTDSCLVLLAYPLTKKTLQCMATIGHTLTGLTLSGCGTIKARDGPMPHVCPAFIVLMAHAVDLVEWSAAVVMDAPADSLFLTHSPRATGFLVLPDLGCSGTGHQDPKPRAIPHRRSHGLQPSSAGLAFGAGVVWRGRMCLISR